jgi:hypothetical protein
VLLAGKSACGTLASVVMDSAAKTTSSSGQATGTARAKSPRRSQRVNLRIPIVAFGDPNRKHTGFEESTCVVRVSAHGGQLELEQGLQLGDCFVLRHRGRREEQVECRVVNLSRDKTGQRLVGFEFTGGRIDFWRMSFPPPGARPILEGVK